MRKRAFHSPCLTTPTSNAHRDDQNASALNDHNTSPAIAPITVEPCAASASPRRRLVSPIPTHRPSTCPRPSKRTKKFSTPRKPTPCSPSHDVCILDAPADLPNLAALAGRAPALQQVLGALCGQAALWVTFALMMCRTPPRLCAWRCGNETTHRYGRPSSAARYGAAAAAPHRDRATPRPCNGLPFRGGTQGATCCSAMVWCNTRMCVAST